MVEVLAYYKDNGIKACPMIIKKYGPVRTRARRDQPHRPIKQTVSGSPKRTNPSMHRDRVSNHVPKELRTCLPISSSSNTSTLMPHQRPQTHSHPLRKRKAPQTHVRRSSSIYGYVAPWASSYTDNIRAYR